MDKRFDNQSDVIDMLIADEVISFALGYGRSILRAIVERQDQLTAVQFNALVLVRRYGPLSPSALSRIMRASKQQITQIIDALEKQHFIVGKLDETDRRTTSYTLTEAGDDFYRENIALFASRVRNLFDYFTEEEKRALHQSSRSFMDLLGEAVMQYGKSRLNLTEKKEESDV